MEPAIREIRERIKAIELQVGILPQPWKSFVMPEKKPSKKK